VEWVGGATPTAFFYDESGTQIGDSVLGDITLTELMGLFSKHSFTPVLEYIPYPDSPKAVREYGGHSYHFYLTENSNSAASEFARAAGGYLVTVTSAQEQDFLGKVLNELKITHAWLGASDQEEEGLWKWNGDGPEKSTVFWTGGSKGSPSGYSLWFSGEPNDIDTEDCAWVFPDGWNDASCMVEIAPLVVEFGTEPLQEVSLPPPEPEINEETKGDL